MMKQLNSATWVFGVALLASCGFAEIDVTTKTATKTYVGKSVQAETNVTHTLEGHEALKRKIRRRFLDIDATLALRERRAGYKGGEWSKNWQKEAAVWFESQDLEKLTSVFEFVDSKGFRHLMSFALVDDDARLTKVMRTRRFRFAQTEAVLALSRASDADVERCSEESKLKTDGLAETIKSESVISSGKVSFLKVFEKSLKVGAGMKTAIVYGIPPSQMR